ncbi:MAG: hypothetical protein HYY93_15095 [Planctomycetes bacterium]|nr:hypothetical protein [Planctomycetota bacterium]
MSKFMRKRIPGSRRVRPQVSASKDAALDPRTLMQPQGPKTGLNAIFGRWPGTESDEEVAAALEDMS